MVHSLVRRSSSGLLLLIIATAAVRANDLRDLYQRARARDTLLQAATFGRDAAIEVRPQARARLLPQAAVSASVTRERAGYGTQAPSAQSAGCSTNALDGDPTCYGTSRGVGLNLSQTLFDVGAFNRLKEANLQATAAEVALHGVEQRLLLRVAQAYFAILAAGDQVSTNRGERDAFFALLNQASVRMRTGVGPRSDVAQAQAFYDATEQSVIDAQNLLDDARLTLNALVGETVGRFAPLRDDIPLTSPEPSSADAWVAAAREENFDVRAAALLANAAERDVSVQRGRGLPTVVLTGSTSTAWQSAPLGGDQRLDTVGVSLQWPLYQGGAVASAVRQSRAAQREAAAGYESALRDAERLTRAAYRNIVSGIERIGAAKRAVSSGREAVEATRRAVEFGTGTEFDLLNAQNNYYTAIRAYSQARYDYLTNVLTLKLEAGRLTEMDLDAIDDLLVDEHG